MPIKLVKSETEILQCYPVMIQLRPNLVKENFVQQVQLLIQEGYQLSFSEIDRQVIAVAGFRIASSLSWKKYLYVHDLVVEKSRQSQGYGQQLFQWLVDYAKQYECQQLHLDSGVQRFSAHRFYLQQYMAIKGHHFSLML